MIKIPVTLKTNANIFGFQFKEGTHLVANESYSAITAKYKEDAPYDISLAHFSHTPDDFIVEAEKINVRHEDYEKNGTPAIYSICFSNKTDNPKNCTLFGLNQYLLSPNFGSSPDVVVKPIYDNVSYLEILNYSASRHVKTNLIRIETDNIIQITNLLTLTEKKPNGDVIQKLIIPQAYISGEIKDNKLDVSYETKIDGNMSLSFVVLPNTSGTIHIFGEYDFEGYESNLLLEILNALISCQIQQGSNFVDIEYIDKFIDDKYTGWYSSLKISLLKKLVDKNIIKKDSSGMYGFNFKLHKLNGNTLNNVDLITLLEKSEYNLTETK